MERIQIIEEVLSLLPENIRENVCFKELVSRLEDIVDTLDIVSINVRADLIDRNKDLLDSVIGIDIDSPVIFSILAKECEFTVEGKEIVIVTFTEIEDEGEYRREITSEVTINESETLWEIMNVLSDRANYYHEYSADLFVYNKDGDQIKFDGKEEFLDDNFAGVFGIPLEEARECRLNYEEYRGYVNEVKAMTYLSGIDDLESNYFMSPFEMKELGTLFGVASEETDEEEGTESDYDGYDDGDDGDDGDDNSEEDYLDEVIVEEALEKVEQIVDEMKRIMGNLGLFSMSLNLFYNVNDYISGKVVLLDTKGIFIRKLDNQYTMFCVYLSDDQTMVIPRVLSKEEAKRLYEKDERNKDVLGLDSFFGVSKSLDMKPKKPQKPE